jgi:hypothetical protein
MSHNYRREMGRGHGYGALLLCLLSYHDDSGTDRRPATSHQPSPRAGAQGMGPGDEPGHRHRLEPLGLDFHPSPCPQCHTSPY